MSANIILFLELHVLNEKHFILIFHSGNQNAIRLCQLKQSTELRSVKLSDVQNMITMQQWLLSSVMVELFTTMLVLRCHLHLLRLFFYGISTQHGCSRFNNFYLFIENLFFQKVNTTWRETNFTQSFVD